MAPKIIDDYGSMPARDYWRMRGERTFPATVRFTARMEAIPPEPPDYSAEERSGFCLEAEPGYQYINGYPVKL